MYCKNCGNMLNSDDKFCSKCGTEVKMELPKGPEPASMFLGQKDEPAEKKPKRVIHLDEFNWNLEGYPTTPRKTEDVDFDWGSVIEERETIMASAEEPAVKELFEEPVVEAAAQEGIEETQPEAIEETAGSVLRNDSMGDFESLEQIFKEVGTTPIEEPTKLIDKAQLKAESVDRFYVFNKKQEEFQALLDQEYERIQNDLLSKSEEKDITDVEAKKNEGTVQPTEEPSKPEALDEEPAASVEPEVQAGELSQPEAVVEEPVEPAVALEEPVEVKTVEKIAVVWAKAPAGIVVQASGVSAEEEPSPALTTDAEPAPVPDIEVPAEPDRELQNVQPEETEQDSLTFADIFRDDEDEASQKKEGNFLKIIAIILCILVVVELCILGVQRFAPNSGVGKLIDRAYSTVLEFFTDTEEAEEATEMEGPSEIEQLISSQIEKNENIVTVIQNNSLLFEEGEDYGYDEFANTYAFRNSPWYDTEEGTTVTFGDEIIGILIQYYSALPDKINDVNNDVVDFIDKTSDLYEKVDSIEGIEDKGYMVTQLEIGELRTGSSGFYVLTRVTTEDKENPDGATETQIVYLEPNTSKKIMKIMEIQTI